MGTCGYGRRSAKEERDEMTNMSLISSCLCFMIMVVASYQTGGTCVQACAQAGS